MSRPFVGQALGLRDKPTARNTAGVRRNVGTSGLHFGHGRDLSAPCPIPFPSNQIMSFLPSSIDELLQCTSSLKQAVAARGQQRFPGRIEDFALHCQALGLHRCGLDEDHAEAFGQGDIV